MAALIGVVSKGSGGYTAKIPLDLLAQDGVPPEQGDDVSFSVEATVKSVDAEDATVSIQSVNGEPVNESPSDEAAEDQGEASGGPPQPGGQAGGASGAGGRGWPARTGAISPATLALGAALKKKARGQPLPF
jgi:hypothetical protein